MRNGQRRAVSCAVAGQAFCQKASICYPGCLPAKPADLEKKKLYSTLDLGFMLIGLLDGHRPI